MNKAVELKGIIGASNAAKQAIEAGIPYTCEAEITGTADMLFHRYQPEAVEAKSKAAKNSVAKKSDDLESYVYRNESGEVCIPGEYLRGAIITAAKFRQDPRSPRKSAMDLYKAALIVETQLASLGKPVWDYEDRRRVMVQRNAVSRIRPAFRSGWKATFSIAVLLPEYIAPADLHDVIANAGKLVGIADFRPTYGRFAVTRFEVV